MRRLLVVLLGLAPALAGAQSTDVFYRSWQWSRDPSAGRAAGLAGAIAAVGDEGSGIDTNPASLSTLSKVEVVLSLVDRGADVSAVGDRLVGQSRLGFAGLAGRLSRRCAVGAYLVEPHAVRIGLAPLSLSNGTREQGGLDALVTEAGGSAAIALTPTLHLGLRLNATHLRIDGQYAQQGGATAPRLLVESQGSRTRVASSLGLLYEPSRRLRLGLVRSSGARFALEREASSPQFDLGLDAGSPYQVAQPSVIAGGLALRPRSELLLAGQLDYVRYGTLSTPPVLGGYSGRDYAIYAWEPRLAAEVSVPLSSLSLQVRAGLHHRGGGSLQGTTLATAAAAPIPGPDAPEVDSASSLLAELTAASAPPGSAAPTASTTVWLGGSVVTTRGLRLDAAVGLGGRRLLVLGGSLRF